MEEFITKMGQKLEVHEKKDCSGFCPIHNPSDHHMKDWPLYWRSDLGIFERIDPEGVGHPDIDSLNYIKSINPKLAEGLSIHGCNGLCNSKNYKKYLKNKLTQKN